MYRKSFFTKALVRASSSSRRIAVSTLLIIALVSGFAVFRADAQGTGAADAIQQILQGISNNSSSATGSENSSDQSGQSIIRQSPNQFTSLPPSRLEQIISSRAGVSLQQFGYDQIGNGRDVSVLQSGAVQDSYILGPGDEIVLSLRGQDSSEYRATVDRNGRVAFPRINPILAAGRRLSDFRADLMAAAQRAYLSTQVFISLGKLRQISVTVVGEVNNPGTRLVTGLSTPIDAILLSGGIAKTGSLRNVKLIRAGQTRTIDLYSFLTQRGGQQTTLLTDGDRIVVPALGRIVAVTGWLRRPGIYELAPGASAISVRSLIVLAGGTEIRGRYRLSVLRAEANGILGMISANESSSVRDGEILFVQPGANEITQQVILSGNTSLAGAYSVGKATRLSSVLSAPGSLGKNPYTLFGLIVRTDPRTRLVQLIPFTPVAVLNSTEDMELLSKDVVRVFTASEARLLSADIAEFKRRVAAVTLKQRFPLNQSKSLLSQQASDPVSDTAVERQVLADYISQKTLGDSGMLADRLPSNEYPPYGLTQDQKTYLQNAIPPFSPSSQPAVGQSTSSPSPTLSQEPLNGSSSYSSSPQTVAQLPLTANSGLATFLANQQNQDSAAQNLSGVLSSGTPLTLSQVQPSAAVPSPYSPFVPPNFESQSSANGGFPSNWEIQTFSQLARQLQTDPLVLMHFLSGQSLSVSGSVLGAGIFLIGPHATMQDLVAAAGGLGNWTDLSRVELISTDVTASTGRANTQNRIVSLTDPATLSLTLHPRDEIRFNEIYARVGAGAVTIQGQVRYAGTYNIERGEHLSELLLRAGGLTDVAYPYGTVFLRKSLAETEADGYRRAADEMQNIVVAGLSRIGQDKISPDAFAALNQFTAQLRNTQPLGRMSVIADPALLVSEPSKDPILEPGDLVFIPQRPSTVTVLGQVNQPGSFLFMPDATVDDYIARAGGYGALSDRSLTFVVLPDGSARQAGSSWLNFGSGSIPPGSTIVVERDVAPLDTRQLILDITGILQNLAVSAASLAVISRNN